jgi:hypothetical protein
MSSKLSYHSYMILGHRRFQIFNAFVSKIIMLFFNKLNNCINEKNLQKPISMSSNQ